MSRVALALWTSICAIALVLPASAGAAPVRRHHSTRAHDSRVAPHLLVAGETLQWTRVNGAHGYLLARTIPGQPTRYSTVSGTSSTPSPVPGATVLYDVRAEAKGSIWANRVSISYPSTTNQPTEPGSPATPGGPTSGSSPGTPKRVTSPVTSPPVATPPILPPPAETPPVVTPPAETPPVEEAAPPTSSAFEPGINAGWVYPGQLDLPAATTLGAKVVRVPFPIEWTTAQLEPTIAGWAAIGVAVAPLATFTGTMPTPQEAQHLASWAKAFGPGGSFWASRSDGRLAIKTIEFGNETEDSYQYGDEPGDPSYAARAWTYAIRLREAAEAIEAGGVHVGLLSVAEDWSGEWLNTMYAAVPNLTRYVGGWVAHPYGTHWKSSLEGLLTQTQAHGAASIPIDVTEWGLASDGGRCLTENYGWNPCMNDQEAAETLTTVSSGMRALLGSRLELFLLYQIRDQQPSAVTNEREAYFGALQHENQPKGAYTAVVKQLLAS
jgi:hypothetical protein